LVKSRFGFFSQSLKLRTGVGKDLVDLRLLVGAELKRIEHAFKAFLTGAVAGAAAPPFVSIECERARSAAEQENEYRREPNLPFPFVGDVHAYLPELTVQLSRRYSSPP